jgi:hypothetical protein
LNLYLIQIFLSVFSVCQILNKKIEWFAIQNNHHAMNAGSPSLYDIFVNMIRYSFLKPYSEKLRAFPLIVKRGKRNLENYLFSELLKITQS